MFTKIERPFNRTIYTRKGLKFQQATRKCPSVCASIGFSFNKQEHKEMAVPEQQQSGVRPEYGLTVNQMRVLGIGNDGMTKLPSVEDVVSERAFQELLSPHHFTRKKEKLYLSILYPFEKCSRP